MTSKLAAAVLAKAIADAVNPKRPSNTAVLGEALFHPLTLRIVELLAQRGYRIERIAPDRSLRCLMSFKDSAP